MQYGNESIGSVSPPSAQPSEILDYVSIVCVEEFSTEIHIHLDELMNSELLLFRIAKLYGYPHQIPTAPIRHQNNLMLKPNSSKQIFMKQRTKVFLFKIAQAHRYPTRFLRPT